MSEDYYRLLGVGREAPEREIKKAYYEHARRLHPDKAKTKEEAAQNEKTMALMSKAYNTLKDSKKRADYDATIKGKSPSGPSSAPSSRSTGGSTTTRKAAASVNTKAPSNAPNQPAQSTAPKVDMSAQKKTMAQKAFVKGMQLYKVQNFKEAKGFFEVAVQNDPESEPQYHLKYCQTLMKIKSSFSKAVEHAEKACDMDPYNVEYKLILGTVYESAGVNSKAIDIYEQVLKWDEGNEDAKFRLKMLGVDKSEKKGFLEKLRAKLNGK